MEPDFDGEAERDLETGEARDPDLLREAPEAADEDLDLDLDPMGIIIIKYYLSLLFSRVYFCKNE